MKEKVHGYPHVCSVSVARERNPIVSIELICHDTYGTRIRVEAVDLVRQLREWPELVEPSVSILHK